MVGWVCGGGSPALLGARERSVVPFSQSWVGWVLAFVLPLRLILTFIEVQIVNDYTLSRARGVVEE